MSSTILKRKRDSIEAGKAASKFSELAGWDAPLNTPQKNDQLVKTNGTNGDSLQGSKKTSSELANSLSAKDQSQIRKGKKARREKKHHENSLELSKLPQEEPWMVSTPIAGRMINCDPVFSDDEKFLILADRTTLKVYTTSTSLLTRSIQPSVDEQTRPNARIVTYCLSPTSPNLIWVAFADGAIYCIDWQTGEGSNDFWTIPTGSCVHMAVASMKSNGRQRDVVFTVEDDKQGEWRITANELAMKDSKTEATSKTIYVSKEAISFVKTDNEGAIIVAAAEKSIILGSLESDQYKTVNEIKYQFHVFESSNTITTMDTKCSVALEDLGDEQKGKSAPVPVVDIVIGDVDGVLFLYRDLLRNLVKLRRPELGPTISLVPQKLHWHRQAVAAAKWSEDGNYIISGGKETVLVLWQIDTGKRNFLPHLGAAIQNVVVSPNGGASYAVQLAENSAMVLSTAEMKPITHVAGIQARVLNYEDTKESTIRSIDEDLLLYPIFQRTLAAVNPLNPSRLLLAVGQVQEINPSKPLLVSNPHLQTFDLKSGHSISREALTRSNNATAINVSSASKKLTEPQVTHLKLSSDGNWLATVDVWMPTSKDLDFIKEPSADMNAERWRRREVYLKFWQLTEGKWELVSRINAPHSLGDSTGAGKVLELAVDPSSLRFATIGDDGVVRTWVTKSRKRDNITLRGKDNVALKNWHCHHAMSVGKLGLDDDGAFVPTVDNGSVAFSEDGSILAAAIGNNEGILHLLNPDLGTIRLATNKMFEGAIIKLEFLGQDLITLSDNIMLYDIASDEMRYSFRLGTSVTNLTLGQKKEMLHLAIDDRSQTFAVSLPAHRHKCKRSAQCSLSDQYSELAIFSPNSREPILKQDFPSLVTALIPAVGSEGYLMIDTAAEIYTLHKKGSQAITSLAQPTSTLNLDVEDDAPADVMEVDEEAEEEEDVLEIAPTANAHDSDDDYDLPVVRAQQLSEVFDVGPAFALPPLEEMFLQVAGLYMGAPLQAEGNQ